MFGSIPEDHIHAHDWRRGVTRVGSIPAELVSETTDGIADWDIPIHLKSGLDRPRTASLVWSPLLMPPRQRRRWELDSLSSFEPGTATSIPICS
jgi:hypothetical protein